MKSTLKLVTASSIISLFLTSLLVSAETLRLDDHTNNIAANQSAITSDTNTRMVIIQNQPAPQVSATTADSDVTESKVITIINTKNQAVNDDIMNQARLIAHDAEVAAQLEAELEAEANFAAKRAATTKSNEEISIPF